jgi:hypothetical protein
MVKKPVSLLCQSKQTSVLTALLLSLSLEDKVQNKVHTVTMTKNGEKGQHLTSKISLSKIEFKIQN